MVKRIYVARRDGFDVEARHLRAEIAETTGVHLHSFAVINRYDIEGVDDEALERAKRTVFAEPQSDVICGEPQGGTMITVEPLPGQFDQRGDSAEQCIQMLTGGARPRVRTAKVYIADGLSEADAERVRAYLINPVECREALNELPETLELPSEPPRPVITLDGFTAQETDGLRGIIKQYGLAMDEKDIAFLQSYFTEENRDPTLTELKVVDTYWSDHCRHTTFSTVLNSVDIEDERVRRAYNLYLEARAEVYGETDRPVTLMDIATMGMKTLKKRGVLKNLDESDEINACSILVDAKIDGKIEPWVVMFKNETHNHPTEIEPFGGAATCLGGAIRDPLSGRSYVYQAMRVTGAPDPRVDVRIDGKLPRRALTRTAAAGYSSYGNQIGIATGLVDEVYHEGYAAKRLEIGAVVGAAPRGNIRREVPMEGDVVILVGGRTGRDGIGGATGSSKAHGKASSTECAAEVQKGNPPEERKLQRLFRNPDVARMIKRCNDFGAGGVAVAVGELADGLRIYLDRVPKKYDGLDGTELAISESQERMAVVVEAKDAGAFIEAAAFENLEATHIADITASPRLVMDWQGATVVDISRAFLDTNGATKYAGVYVKAHKTTGAAPPCDAATTLCMHISTLHAASRRGLAERFDASIGAASVLAPYGGAHRRTPAQAMAATLPSPGGAVVSTATLMAYGFDPALCETDPFGGGAASVVTSVSKLVASGADYRSAYLSLQEYFERLRDEPSRWGKPFSALLGAFEAQIGLGIAAIGGKDSMSGSYLDMDVPPTLVSFALATADAVDIVSPEFKAAGESVYIIEGKDYKELKAAWSRLHSYVKSCKITSAWAVGTGTVAEGVCKMSFGNRIGFAASNSGVDWYGANVGAIIFTSPDALSEQQIGVTSAEPHIELGGERASIDALCRAWEVPLEGVFPTRAAQSEAAPPRPLGAERKGTHQLAPLTRYAKPRATIPVFPGTNCEFDTARAVERAGGAALPLLIRNLTPAALADSVDALIASIKASQMLILPGGFSGGDEPDGSAKFIVSLFSNAAVADAVHDLLYNRDGLVLGICNGFQALVKLGLLPEGRISPRSAVSPTLTHNAIGRHAACYVHTIAETTASPWLRLIGHGDIHTIPVSHGEGRFTAPPDVIDVLFASGQVAFRYCTPDGTPSNDYDFNPNGSVEAIEGIISADGRILGKMGHTERSGLYVGKNIVGNKVQPIFEGGVGYYL